MMIFARFLPSGNVIKFVCYVLFRLKVTLKEYDITKGETTLRRFFGDEVKRKIPGLGTG